MTSRYSITTDGKASDYYISYNNLDVNTFGDVTTAIVITGSDTVGVVFCILNGNHKDQLNNCSCLGECLRYFINNKDLINKYSTFKF